MPYNLIVGFHDDKIINGNNSNYLPTYSIPSSNNQSLEDSENIEWGFE